MTTQYDAQTVNTMHTDALRLALGNEDTGKLIRVHKGTYYACYVSHALMVKYDDTLKQWCSVIKRIDGLSLQSLLFVLSGNKNDTHDTLKDAHDAFMRFVDHVNDKPFDMSKWASEQAAMINPSIDNPINEDKTMNKTYDIEQVGKYFVAHIDGKQYYCDSHNEATRKVDNFTVTHDYTIKHLSYDDFEMALEAVDVNRNNYCLNTYGLMGYDAVLEYKRDSGTDVTTIKRISDIDSDAVLWQLAEEIADIRKQQKHYNREHKQEMVRDYTPKTRVYGEPCNLVYHSFPKQQSTLLFNQIMRDGKRVVIFSHELTRRFYVQAFYTQDISISVLGNEFPAMFMRFNGYNGVVTKRPIGIGKRTNKRHNDNEVTQNDNTLGKTLRPITPLSKKQRRFGKAAKMLISDYDATQKHYDIVTILGKSKQYVCSQFKQHNRIVYTDQGLPIWNSSKTLFNYIEKITGCDISMIPTNQGRIVSFVYAGIGVIIDHKID